MGHSRPHGWRAKSASERGAQVNVRNRIFVMGATVALGLGGAFATPPAMATGSAANDTARYASFEDAVPGLAPAKAGKTAIYVDSLGRPLNMRGVEARPMGAANFPCTPVSGRDNPHRSSTGVAVSGHGWWDKGNCEGSQAVVWNCLYEYYTDGTWRRKACSPKKTLWPGGGSANRTVARRTCDNTLSTSWRNHVDVDVIDEWDTAEQPYRQANVACRYYGPDA